MTDKYAGAPTYMESEVVRAVRYAADSDVRVPDDRFAGGEDVVQVPAGNWLVHAGAERHVVPDATFRASHVRFRGAEGAFATRGRRFRALLVGARIHVEGDFESRDPASFLAGVARVGDDGEPLTHAALPLHVQARMLVGVAGGASHLAELRALRAKAASRVVLDPRTSTDLDMFDVVVNARADTVPDAVADANGDVTPEGLVVREGEDGDVDVRVREGSLLDRVSRATGLPPVVFQELRHYETYKVEAYRSLGRRLLAPFLGGYPMETVLLVPTPPAMCGPEDNPVEGWAAAGDLVAESDGVVVPEVPGYVTSEFRHYRRDGVDVLCFSDSTAAYSYVWPSPEVPSPAP